MSTENSEAEEPNAEEALASLAQIEKNTKRILDDDWNEDSDSSKKRTTDNATGEPSVKKPKLDSDASDNVVALKKKIKKGLGKLKRSEIEEMVATKCLELMTNKSELGKLRQQADSYEETVERWKRRAGALSKQCTDLSTVMRKYITGKACWLELDFNASPHRLQDEGSRQGGTCAHHAIRRPPGKPFVKDVSFIELMNLDQVLTSDQRRQAQQRATASASAARASKPSPSPQPRASAGTPSTPRTAAKPSPSVGGLVPGSVTITPSKVWTCIPST